MWQFFVGIGVGWVICAMMTLGKINDLESEINWLSIQLRKKEDHIRDLVR